MGFETTDRTRYEYFGLEVIPMSYHLDGDAILQKVMWTIGLARVSR